MAQTNGTSKKGFASMDRQKQREIASKGGRASAKGDTSRRGFASMDKNKQREISSQGGRSQGRHLKRTAEAAGQEGAEAAFRNEQIPPSAISREDKPVDEGEKKAHGSASEGE